MSAQSTNAHLTSLSGSSRLSLRQLPPSCADMMEQQRLLQRALNQPLHQEVAIRGATQGLAMTAFLKAEQDTLLIAPTGMGKSALLLLAADDPLTTLVILPYTALKANTLIRGRALPQDKWQLWSQVVSSGTHQQDVPISGVVLLSTTEAMQPVFRAWASTASSRRRLKRVVIDEVHVIVTESSFRADIVALDWMRQLRVPLFLMTATLLPQEQHLVSQALGIQELVVIRGSPERPNIRYQVQPITRNHYRPFKTRQATNITPPLQYIRCRKWTMRSKERLTS